MVTPWDFIHRQNQLKIPAPSFTLQGLNGLKYNNLVRNTSTLFEYSFNLMQDSCKVAEIPS